MAGKLLITTILYHIYRYALLKNYIHKNAKSKQSLIL